MQARPTTLWADTLDPGDRALLDPGVPADLERRPDVLVVGGGVIGLATAVFCRRAGLGRVVVIEAARLAAGAPGGAGGALVPELHQLSDPPAFVALARSSLGRYRRHRSTAGTGHRGCPGGLGRHRRAPGAGRELRAVPVRPTRPHLNLGGAGLTPRPWDVPPACGRPLSPGGGIL